MSEIVEVLYNSYDFLKKSWNSSDSLKFQLECHNLPGMRKNKINHWIEDKKVHEYALVAYYQKNKPMII